MWSSCGCGGYSRHQEHRSSSANTFGDCHQVSLSVWAQTPPEMVIQGQVSLVSHKGNLKAAPEWLSQEKYYTALCLYLNEFNFPSCKTRWPLDRVQCAQVNRAGRSIQTSLLSRINDEKEMAVKGGRGAPSSATLCLCLQLTIPKSVFPAESYFSSCVCHHRHGCTCIHHRQQPRQTDCV